MKGGKHYTRQNQIQSLLHQLTRNLSEEALQSDKPISESKLEKLERLVRLVEIQKAAKHPSPQVRWLGISLLAVTLTIVSLLLFARVASTEIELDVSLSEVSFRLPEQQVLTEEMQLSSLGVSGIKEMQLPRSENREAQVFHTRNDSEAAIRLAPKITNQQGGSVTLGAIILPAGAHISLSPMEIPQQYRLSLKGANLELRAGVSGLIEMGRPGKPPEQVNFLSPKSVIFSAGSEEINLDINLLAGTKNAFPQQLLADSLSLSRIEEHVNGEHTIVRRISTILDGALYFEALEGKERRLRPGQEIRFESSEGEIRTLALKEDHIAFAFHGRVRGMTTGGDKNQISLMPTYLEWLSARHGLTLLWGTSLYVFGIILSVIRWWRTSS